MGERPTAEGLFKYLREHLKYVEQDMKLMEALRDGLYHSPEVNMIDDLEFSYQFEKMMNKMTEAIDDEDEEAELAIKSKARLMYIDQQLKIMKATEYPQGLTQLQEMSLQEKADKEFEALIELYQEESLLDDVEPDDVEKLMSELLELYSSMQD